MNPVQTVLTPLQSALGSILAYLPSLFWALVILIVGIVVAILIGKSVSVILQKLGVDSAVERVGFKKVVGREGFSVSGFIGWLVEWFIIFIFLIAVADTVGLPQISAFINQVAGYLPNVIVAAVILILGAVVANALSQVAERGAASSKVLPGSVVGAVVKWAVLIFTIFAALVQLRIAPSIIQILFAGIVATLVIALGLAFGLGGQEAAKKIWERITSGEMGESKRR